jgi:DNA-binding transcriptional LysR family regulator
MAIDLRHLRYLVAVAEAGSVTAAARQLYITQPALSVAVRELERELGVTLLRRHSRGVDLTSAGQAFVERSRRALDIVEEAVLTAKRIGGPPVDQLVVGLLPATFSAAPRAVLAAFRDRHPRVQIKYRELSYITHTRDLVTGRVDVAFLWPPYAEPGLRFLGLSQEPRVLGVAPHHPLADRDAVSLDDILDLPFPGFHPASSGGWFASWFFDSQREAPARTTHDETTTPFEMALVVHEGRAIAPAARSFALAFPSEGVRWLQLTDAPPATLALAWHPDNRNAAVGALVEIARAVMPCWQGLVANERSIETGPALSL